MTNSDISPNPSFFTKQDDMITDQIWRLMMRMEIYGVQNGDF